ncbi:MAG: hypothetical protein AAGJ83_09975, partial [Planctomycetota bacterium]
MIRILLLSLVGFAVQTSMRAQSALEELSGFDTERLRRCYPVTDTNQASEMAKLLYRVDRVSEASMKALTASEIPSPTAVSGLAVGEAVSIDGTIHRVRGYRVPESLVEFLDLEEFREVQIDPRAPAGVPAAESASSVRYAVFVPKVPSKLALGDRVSCRAFVISTQKSPGEDAIAVAMVAPKLSWFPAKTERLGWELLRDRGVDLALLSELVERDRQPLREAD